MGTGSRVQSFPRAFPSSTDVPVLLLNQPIREFRNDAGDGKENVERALSLDKQNKNFARASHLFVHFFTVAVLLRRENT